MSRLVNSPVRLARNIFDMGKGIPLGVVLVDSFNSDVELAEAGTGTSSFLAGRLSTMLLSGSGVGTTMKGNLMLGSLGQSVLTNL